jgi:putative peptidoglycan lipid II flippase
MIAGALLALYAPAALGIAPKWGAAGITIASGMGAWLELMLLRSALRSRLGIGERLTSTVLRLWVCAAVAALAAWGVKVLVVSAHPWVVAVLVLGTFGLVYVATTAAARVEEARTLLARAMRPR